MRRCISFSPNLFWRSYRLRARLASLSSQPLTAMDSATRVLSFGSSPARHLPSPVVQPASSPTPRTPQTLEVSSPQPGAYSPASRGDTDWGKWLHISPPRRSEARSSQPNSPAPLRSAWRLGEAGSPSGRSGSWAVRDPPCWEQTDSTTEKLFQKQKLPGALF